MKFEEKLKALEELVRKMESGAMDIDSMIKAFEDGRKLVDECTSDLKAIRMKIEKVTASGVEEVAIVNNSAGERDAAL